MRGRRLTPDEAEQVTAAILAGEPGHQIAQRHGLTDQAVSNRRTLLRLGDGRKQRRHEVVQRLLDQAHHNEAKAERIEIAATILEAERVARGDTRVPCVCGVMHEEGDPAHAECRREFILKRKRR